MIKKILIANRGEIAVRIMRTCRDLEISTVAVYSESDRASLPVRYATEAYLIDSYLNIKEIIGMAKKSNADAIHPGYGFLSENFEFAKACEKANIIFIGPNSSSIENMGSKIKARQIMQDAGVPVTPGLDLNNIQDKDFPIMLKASAGGGGKGMRRVNHIEDLKENLEAAQREAETYFGNKEIYVEKFLDQPRHIEVQILADKHNNIISFPERECSVQRRHQKVIEESPSCLVDLDLREKLGSVARQAAQAVDYIGAGTIEFLIDSDKNFYFMEMNTRLQVEHPVTELITGVDLVEEQIKIAQGEKLSLTQESLKLNGWSIEARICAEDPTNNFLPSPGLIRDFRHPSGPYIRLDSCLYGGLEITPEYDSMLGKLISWAPTRDLAIKRLDRALSELNIKGCITNIYFLRQILDLKEFVSGDYDTSILERLKINSLDCLEEEDKKIALLGAALFSYERDNKNNIKISEPNKLELSNWQILGRK